MLAGNHVCGASTVETTEERPPLRSEMASAPPSLLCDEKPRRPMALTFPNLPRGRSCACYRNGEAPRESRRAKVYLRASDLPSWRDRALGTKRRTSS